MARTKISYGNDGFVWSHDYDILDKNRGIRDYVAYMLDRTNQMFQYKGLPDTIPDYQLELLLQMNGSIGIMEVDGNIYAIIGSAGGPPDPYYRATRYIVANPALSQKTFQFKILNHLPPYDTVEWTKLQPCVYMKNDTRAKGLLPLYLRYATQMVENDVSIRSAQINARQQVLISASTGPELDGAKSYIEDLVAGKPAVVAERPFLEGIKATNVATQSSNSIIQLIELQQYLKASWYNELGLNHAFNMKREYVSAEEIAASTDMLLPLVDDMLFNRQLAIEAINKEFGTNISVDKGSAWDNKETEIENDLEQEGDDIGESNVNEADAS